MGFFRADEAELRTGWRGLIGASHSGKFSLFQQDKMAPQHLLKELSQELVTATFLENHMKTNVSTNNAQNAEIPNERLNYMI